jgi:Ca2+-binding EF-hand superfamily protein
LKEFLGELGYAASTEAILDAAQDAGLKIEDDLLTKLAFQENFKDMKFNFSSEELCVLVSTLRAREGFTHIEMEDFRQIFDSCKPVGCEEMGTPAITKTLRLVGHPLPFDVVQLLVTEVDVDGDSVLDFTMFLKLIRKCTDRELKQAVAAFNRLDALSIGVLDERQQLIAFKSIGCVNGNGEPPSRTPEECNGMTCQDFVKVVRRFRNERVPLLRQNAGFTEIEVSKLREFFGKFDTNGDDDITPRELARLIEVLFPSHAHAPEWRPYLMQLLSEVDTDGSGSLCFDEFVCLMRKIYDQEDECKRVAETKTIQELGFTILEASKFRELFLAAVADETCQLSYSEIKAMLSRCSLFAHNKKCDKLKLHFQQVVGTEDCADLPGVGFLEFLRIMKLVSTDAEELETQ